MKTSAIYLCLTIRCRGFKKEVNDTLDQKFRCSCSAFRGQPFFTKSLPLSTIGTLYRMNVRSILMYGAMLSINMHKLLEIDENLLNQTFKKFLFTAYPLLGKLLYHLCIMQRRYSSFFESGYGVNSNFLKTLRNSEPYDKAQISFAENELRGRYETVD